MRTTFFRENLISNMLLIVTILGTTVLLSSSSKELPKKESVAKTPISLLDITFMPNTSDELKDRAIRAIEENLITSLPQLTDKDAFTVTKSNADSYRLSIVSTSSDCCGPTRPIPCPPCPGLCIQCDKANRSYGILAIKEAN